MLNKKGDDKGDMDDDDSFQLTPQTEATYKKIDEQYAKVMNNQVRHSESWSFIVLRYNSLHTASLL